MCVLFSQIATELLEVRDSVFLCVLVAPSVNFQQYVFNKGFSGGSNGKESACHVGDLGLIPGLGRTPWRTAWQPTPAFLPGELHRQKSLTSYSPWGGRVRHD